MSEYVITEKQDLINIANAIREKAGTTDEMILNEMATLIAAIGSGEEIALGEITLTSEESVTLKGVFPVRSQAPKAYFMFEYDTSWDDTTHTKRRPLMVFGIRKDCGKGTDTVGSYRGVYCFTNSQNKTTYSSFLNSTNMFNGYPASISSDYGYIKGQYTSGNLSFASGASGGLIAGRTYIWGVIPWDE